jgi:hypothetical protein
VVLGDVGTQCAHVGVLTHDAQVRYGPFSIDGNLETISEGVFDRMTRSIEPQCGSIARVLRLNAWGNVLFCYSNLRRGGARADSQRRDLVCMTSGLTTKWGILRHRVSRKF